MSAVAAAPAEAASDVDSRLAFFKNLQVVTNKVHATSNIDEIMLELSGEICNLFNADRRPEHCRSCRAGQEDRQYSRCL